MARSSRSNNLSPSHASWEGRRFAGEGAVGWPPPPPPVAALPVAALPVAALPVAEAPTLPGGGCRGNLEMGRATVTKKIRKSADAFSTDDDDLLAELGVLTEVKPVQTYTAKQERMIAGFEDIQRFFREHGRLPQHGDDNDIFERIYAVRLDRIRDNAECMKLLRDFDEDGVLAGGDEVAEPGAEFRTRSDDELLDELGVGVNDDITQMKHVRSAAERNPPDEIAQRTPCEDFDDFRTAFDEVQADLKSGRQTTELFRQSSRSKIQKGDWFIVDGQTAFVAHADKWFTPEHGERDRRLRVIFANGTESDLLMRSLRRALNKDESSRRIVPPQPTVDEDYEEADSLFGDVLDGDDQQSGTIYVARSLSGDPFVSEHRDVLHKIGVTGGDPKTRVAGAKKDPTFLLAEAELVASYQLANINRRALELTIHKFFARARLDVVLSDRFGERVHPREWFLVPLTVIEQTITRIKDGSIHRYFYDPEAARLRHRAAEEPNG